MIKTESFLEQNGATPCIKLVGPHWKYYTMGIGSKFFPPEFMYQLSPAACIYLYFGFRL